MVALCLHHACLLRLRLLELFRNAVERDVQIQICSEVVAQRLAQRDELLDALAALLVIVIRRPFIRHLLDLLDFVEKLLGAGHGFLIRP